MTKNSTTTNVVDDTAYSSVSAPSWMRTTLAYGHISDGKASEPETSRPVEKTHYIYPTAFGILETPMGVIPPEFRRSLLHHNSSTVPELSCGVVFEILCLAVLIEYCLVTDGRTDGHMTTEYTALSRSRAGKKNS